MLLLELLLNILESFFVLENRNILYVLLVCHYVFKI